MKQQIFMCALFVLSSNVFAQEPMLTPERVVAAVLASPKLIEQKEMYKILPYLTLKTIGVLNNNSESMNVTLRYNDSKIANRFCLVDAQVTLKTGEINISTSCY